GDGLAFRHRPGVLTATASIHQRSATLVLNDKFVAEYFLDVPLDRDRAAIRHLSDRHGLQKQHGARTERLEPVISTGAARRANDEDGNEHTAIDQTSR